MPKRKKQGTEKRWQEERASKIFAHSLALLRSNRAEPLIDLLSDAWEQAFPYYQRATFRAPLCHHAHVLQFAAMIGLEEKLLQNHLRSLLLAAIFHDTGWEQEAGGKILRGREFAQAARERERLKSQRLLHAKRSAEIAGAFLRGCAHEIPQEEIKLIQQLCERHDYPAVARMAENEVEMRRYLFSHDADDLLQRILREADCLWMLTRDGVATALLQQQLREHWKHVSAQITHNIIRQWEERQLYERAFADKAEAYGFEAQTAFFTTKFGKRFFLLQQDILRSYSLEDWRRYLQQIEE